MDFNHTVVTHGSGEQWMNEFDYYLDMIRQYFPEDSNDLVNSNNRGDRIIPNDWAYVDDAPEMEEINDREIDVLVGAQHRDGPVAHHHNLPVLDICPNCDIEGPAKLRHSAGRSQSGESKQPMTTCANGHDSTSFRCTCHNSDLSDIITESDVRIHLKDMHDISIASNKSIDGKSRSIIRHIWSTHLKQTMMRCRECGKPYARRDSLLRHLREQHGTSPDNGWP
ncbi:hypothetical protein CERSUDRAFT_127068 [Gelatoporia subvermispora B]|uniref:C2H2-type domain-containing protein n=1 Tax=Ceriporiopsis subvermispora (strain B) TaxID=914234 RepID=M2Q517_CERS8|nr:hypothetical protein CERSUDRAFT_127068 [Gelatoporia subvermispora B]